MLRPVAAALSAVRRFPRWSPRPVKRLDQIQISVIPLGIGLLPLGGTSLTLVAAGVGLRKRTGP
jgi:hypothetical protein